MYSSLKIQEWGIEYLYNEQTIMVRVVQRHHGDIWQRISWDPRIAGLRISLTDRGKWTLAGESYFDFPVSFSVEESTSLEDVSWISCSTSLWKQHVQLMETVLFLVWNLRMDSFRGEAICHVQEIHRVDICQDCAPQGIAVHVLVWDPRGGVYDSSSLDGVYCVSHRWTWDPGIIFGLIQLFLEDKQYSSREDCNVPTLGHHCITECYDDQSSQMDVIASTRDVEGYFGVRLASLILFHHYEPFSIAWLWFRCIPMISMILSYFGL
jgi:hypothetical protein